MGRLGMLGRVLTQWRCLRNLEAYTKNIDRTLVSSSVINKCTAVKHKTDSVFNRLMSPAYDQICPKSCLLNNKNILHVQCRTMAGHSHWHNIRHIKAAADAKKQSIIGVYMIQLKGAINDGGADPEMNNKLRSILDKMRAANIPKADIKRYLDNATKKAASAQTMYVEVRGPQGSVFVVQLDSEAQKKSRDLVSSLLKKTVGKLPSVQSFQNLFEMKGVVIVPVTKEMNVSNMDPYLEIAIEAGAEDVILTNSEDGEEGEMVLKFHTDPKTVGQVAKEIEETHNLEVTLSQVELIPSQYVTIDSKEDVEACRKIVEKLESHDEFVKLFDNISVPEE